MNKYQLSRLNSRPLSPRPVWSVVLAAVLFLWGGITQLCQADFILTTSGVATTEDFDEFRGDGFSPSPTSTQLDSNTYAVFGMSDGTLLFGGTETTGDFARGVSTGGVTTGGGYAFNIGVEDYGVGVQQTDDDFTPGMLTIRVLNQTGTAIHGFVIDGDGYFWNDGDRSTLWSLEISLDDINYNRLGSIESDEQAIASPDWELNSLFAFIDLGGTVVDGQQFFIRLTGEDLSGTGERDEFALSRLSLTVTVPVPEPGMGGALLMFLTMGVASYRRR